MRKAFDFANHDTLMQKLIDCGISLVYVNMIYYWFSNQTVNVKYGSSVSSKWQMKNGVRNGGVLSSLFISIM